MVEGGMKAPLVGGSSMAGGRAHQYTAASCSSTMCWYFTFSIITRECTWFAWEKHAMHTVLRDPLGC